LWVYPLAFNSDGPRRKRLSDLRSQTDRPNPRLLSGFGKKVENYGSYENRGPLRLAVLVADYTEQLVAGIRVVAQGGA
jgi:hypothetical protein